jgi:hypothetical protein
LRIDLTILGNDDSIRHYFSFTGDRIPLFAPFFSVLSYLSTLLPSRLSILGQISPLSDWVINRIN